MKVKRESEVAQSCPTLSDPMDCSLPASSVHGIFQARVLEWDAIAFSIHALYRVYKIHKKENQHCLLGLNSQYPWWLKMAKNLLAMQETQVRSLGGEDP